VSAQTMHIPVICHMSNNIMKDENGDVLEDCHNI
jgi:hypothetical protein